MVKYASNIFEIIDLVYYPSKIFGMAPYSKTLDEHGGSIYTANPINLKSVFHMAGVSLLIIATSSLRITMDIIDMEIDFSLYVLGTAYVLGQLEVIGKLFEMLMNQKYFVACLDLVNNSDDLVKELTFSVSYKLLDIIFFRVILFFPIWSLIAAVPSWETINVISTNGIFSYESVRFIFQLLNVSLIYIIRSSSLYCNLSFVIIIFERFKFLNLYLRCIKNDGRSEVIKSVIERTRNLYHVLFKLTSNVNITFGWAILARMTMWFLEVISLLVALKYSTIMGFLHITVGMSILDGVEMITMLVICQKLKNE
ncbi:hypothetical protein ILUMI_26753, partial [Ignelater luminosus]